MLDGEINVGEVMRLEVVTLAPEDRLDVASDIMTLGRIRHMPVVAHDQVVGILTQRDLFRAAISSALQLRPAAEREWLAKIHVREVMTTKVFTVEPDEPVHNAVTQMIEKRVGCLPVVQHSKLVGLLSESDCLRFLARLLDISDARQQLPELPQPE